MKEATGEVSMTVVTLVAIGVIGFILAFMWPQIQKSIEGLWSDAEANGQYGKGDIESHSSFNEN